MRKRRAIFYDDDPAMLAGLSSFFKAFGYEVMAFGEPGDCAIYEESDHCGTERPCADLMITDYQMPRMSGLELLQRQSRRGCPVDIRNKAVLSGGLSLAATKAIMDLGCAIFEKPCRMSTLAAWALECEQRMDLTQPLGIRRKERRESCSAVAATLNAEGQKDDLYRAEVVNRSRSGLCLRGDKPPDVGKILDLQTRMSLASDRLEVRWMRPYADGRYLAGLSCC